MVSQLELFSKSDLPTAQQEYFTKKRLRELFESKLINSHSVGVDGTRSDKFASILDVELDIIVRKFFAKNYRFSSYKEKLIVRGAGREPRQVSIPTVRDRLVLRAACACLHRHVEGASGVMPHKVVSEVVRALKSALCAAEVDDAVVAVCLSAVSTQTGASSPPSKGVPQGLSVSGALAAIYMREFDSKQISRGFHYFRYVDDILFICPESNAHEVLNEICADLHAIGLIAHELDTKGKTIISSVQSGIEYLGYVINGGSVSVRDVSYKRMFKNILNVFTDYKYRKDVERFLFRLNLKITGCRSDGKRRGWLMFFSKTTDMAQLRQLDEFVMKQVRASQLDRSQYPRVKRFIKSYYEINNNLYESSYIPNFDEFDLDQKIDVVASMLSLRRDMVLAWSADEVERKFSRLVSREVHSLETDLTGMS